MTVRQNDAGEPPEQPSLLELAERVERGEQVELTPEQRQQLAALNAQLAEVVAPAAAEFARQVSAAIAPIAAYGRQMSAALAAFVQYVRQAVIPAVQILRFQAQFAVFLSDIQHQFEMLPPITRAQLDAAVLQVWEADLDVLSEPAPGEPEGTDRSLLAEWYRSLVALLLALYLVCMVDADQVWPDQEWIGKLENHVAFVLAVGGLAYGAGPKRE